MGTYSDRFIYEFQAKSGSKQWVQEQSPSEYMSDGEQSVMEIRAKAVGTYKREGTEWRVKEIKWAQLMCRTWKELGPRRCEGGPM